MTNDPAAGAAEERTVPAAAPILAPVLARVADGVLMLDEAFHVTFANPAAHGIFDGALEIGGNLADLIGTSQQTLRELVAQPASEPLEIGFVREGITTPLELHFTAVGGAGSLRGVAVVARNLADRKRREARGELLASVLAALSSTLHIQTAMQRLADLVVGWFADACVIDIAEGDSITRVAVAAAHDDDRPIAQELLRFGPGQRPRHPAQDVLRDAAPSFVNNLTADDWRPLTASDGHLDVVRRLGLHAYATMPLMAGLTPVGALTLVRGRSPEPFTDDDAQLLAELARFTATAVQNAWLYESAEAANRSKDDFLATLSHELRTPMTSVLGWIQVMRLGGLQPEELDEAINAIEMSARAQAQLIDDLLDLSRIQMGKMQLQLETIDLSHVLTAAVETLRPAAAAKGITLSTELRALPPITGDSNRLQQVFWNLLSNAIKFTDRGGHVSVRAEAEGATVHARVADTGRGVTPEFLPVMFERFRQADSATTRRYGGLGLGLAIVKQIVEIHGGTVSAESAGPGQGATFHVFLPLQTE